MGLFNKAFSKALDTVEEYARKGEIADAIKVLKGQLIIEQEFMKDLLGLQVAITTYHEKIQQMIHDVPQIKKVVKSETLQNMQMKELHRHVAEAREALTEIKALLSKVWRERRRLN
ncbi:MAG: hypothetical protein Q8R37_02915 [Nanoarchaeota archaeon]|nr:hypothetical protein [Nanoarchaeota archaeon]